MENILIAVALGWAIVVLVGLFMYMMFKIGKWIAKKTNPISPWDKCYYPTVTLPKHK